MKEKHFQWEEILKKYKGKKVFLTGHTGFKGSWMSKVLVDAGAEVTGYGLEAPTKPSLFALGNWKAALNSIEGDIRDRARLEEALCKARPEIVIHMAAQPIVRDSYKDPVYTYETNVMGTVYLLEGVKKINSVRSLLNVTTDKVYDNKEWEWGYRETDPLDGYDPYSNSKSCSELVTHSYDRSFLKERGLAVSTARAGNVIGGGDFANDRLLPDCFRAAVKGEDIILRNPSSTRPFQHVLEPVFAYLMIAMGQFEEPELAGAYNVGPDMEDCVTSGRLADLFCSCWGGGVSWRLEGDGGPHEANFLKLDCSRIQNVFSWKASWHIDQAMKHTVDWYRIFANGGDLAACMEGQIRRYIEGR